MPFTNVTNNTQAQTAFANATAGAGLGEPVGGLNKDDHALWAIAEILGPVSAQSGEVGVANAMYPVGDVRRYGAATSGNNTTKVNAAITSAAALGVPCVFPILVTCSGQLSIPSGSTLLGVAGGGVVFDWQLASVAQSYLINSDTTNGNSKITLRNLWVQGAGTGAPYGNATSPVSGVLIRRATDVLIEGCTFYRVPGINVAIQGVQRFQVQRNVVREAGRDGITCWWYTDNLTDGVISGNVLHTIGDDGIAVHASSAGNPNTSVRPCRIVIANNTIVAQTANTATGAGRGIICDGVERFVIVGNNVSDTFASGIHVSDDGVASSSFFRSRRFVVADNVVHRGGQAGDGTQPRIGVRVTASDYGSVTGNVVTESYSVGVYCSDAVAVKIHDNTVEACGTLITDFGIDMDGTSSGRNVLHCSVRGNSVTNCLGGGIRCNYTKQTGATGNTVTDNGNAGDGTATNGSGIILSGDTDFFADANTVTETRSGAARTQTFGIVVPNVGGTPTVTIGVNVIAGHPGQSISIANTATIMRAPRGLGVSSDRGDANVTLSNASDAYEQRFDTTLTANRTITLSTSGTYAGQQFRIARTGLGAFTLDVGGLKTIPSATAAFVEITFNGTAWKLSAYAPI